MAKIKSISEFVEATEKTAKKLGKTYISVGIETSKNLITGNVENVYRCYVDGFTHFMGNTPEEALMKLKIKAGLIKEKVSDFEITTNETTE